jgi:hypothetical protein
MLATDDLETEEVVLEPEPGGDDGEDDDDDDDADEGESE